MDSTRQWLFHHVATELLNKGFARPDFKHLAKIRGVNEEQIRKIYPDSRVLAKSLIDEISVVYKEIIFDIAKQGGRDSGENLILMLSAGFEYYDSKPILAQIIINALLGSDVCLREYVIDAFEEVVNLMADDLLSAQILPFYSRMMLSDLVVVLISLMFLGGCPDLEMEYMSFVYPRQLSISALKALKTRYHSPRFSQETAFTSSR